MKIRVCHIIKTSFKDAWAHKLAWCKVLFAPLFTGVVGAIVATLPAVLLSDNSTIIQIVGIGAVMLGGIIALLVGFMAIQINAFRYVILNEGGTSWWHLNLNKRMIKLLAYTLFLLIIGGAGFVGAIGLLSLPLFVTIPVGGLLALGVGYILIRISLLSLFIAIDTPRPIRASWDLVKGNVGRVFVITAVITVIFMGVPMILFAPLGFVEAWVSDRGFSDLALLSIASSAKLIGMIGNIIFSIINIAVSAKANALVYDELKKG